MYITKQKQNHTYREQTSGYQWEEGSREGRDKGIGLRQTTIYKINIQQGYILEHKGI